MRCPFCKHNETQVKDSRPSEDFVAIRRRRFCPECEARFTTIERHYVRQLYVMKKNGQRVEFQPDKLIRSLKLCLRKRPISSEKIEQIVNNVTRQLEMLNEPEISSIVIGQHVLEALKTIDNVAYIRYASVYMDFADSTDFQKLIDSLTPIPPDSSMPSPKTNVT
ncbi:MAG: transcriptional repressor NrdR [Alphaproteobacteria bacterium]|jgi:transcriptional repressor NrdR